MMFLKWILICVTFLQNRYKFAFSPSMLSNKLQTPAYYLSAPID